MAVSTSVVIPVRNDAQALPHAVESVLGQRGIAAPEVVIVVGPSNDESMKTARALAASNSVVRVISNPSGRTPDALNLGIASSRGEVIVRVDARSVLPDDYIANALESLHATNAGNVGALQVPVGDSSTQRAIAAAMRSKLGSGGALYRHGTELQRVDTAYLGVFRRDALAEVGGYDVNFDRNQDGELNARLNSAGHFVWLDPRLKVLYRPRGSLRALASQYWQYGWWRQRNVRKNRGSIVLRQLAAPVVVVAVVVALGVAVAGQSWSLVVPASYLAGVSGAAMLSAGLSLIERAKMGAALVTMHFCWGTSFLVSSVASLFRLHKE